MRLPHPDSLACSATIAKYLPRRGRYCRGNLTGRNCRCSSLNCSCPAETPPLFRDLKGVCPEPVLVNRCFSSEDGASKGAFFSHHFVVRGLCLDVAVNLTCVHVNFSDGNASGLWEGNVVHEHSDLPRQAQDKNGDLPRQAQDKTYRQLDQLPDGSGSSLTKVNPPLQGEKTVF